jgi:hypothetical protein
MPILCLDFDGVLHSYTSGWKGADVIPDPPVTGMVEFLEKAVKAFDVAIFSSRTNQTGGLFAMQNWLRKHVMEHFDCTFAGDPKDFTRALALLDAIKWPTEKPAAMVTLDDRAITFTGTWPSIESLKDFKPWNK